jgi:hypothetical protein
MMVLPWRVIDVYMTLDFSRSTTVEMVWSSEGRWFRAMRSSAADGGEEAAKEQKEDGAECE